MWKTIAPFVRRTWLIALLLPIVSGVACLPLSFAVKGTARPIPVTIGLVSGLWGYALMAIVWSGSANQMMGVSGETMTSEVLRARGRDGWRHVNGLQLERSWDIDHVAVGPAGVLVLETKWSRDPWPLDRPGTFYMQDRMAGAARQACRNANDLSAFLSEAGSSTTVIPVAVLWSGSRASSASWTTWQDDRTVMVRGRSFGDWLATLPGDRMTAAEVDRIWSLLDRRARAQDAEAARAGTHHFPTLESLVHEWGIKFVGGIVLAGLGAGLVARWHEWRAQVSAVLVALVGGAYASRFRPVRRIALGWLALTVPMSAVLLAGLVYVLVRS